MILLLSLKPKNRSDTSLIDSVFLNTVDSSYQNSDPDYPVDDNIFEIPFGSLDFGQPSSFRWSDSPIPWIDANGLTESFDQNVVVSPEGDAELSFDRSEIEQEYQVEQADGENVMFSEAALSFLPLPPLPRVPTPPYIQILEPSCPGGKRPFCCSGGKAADNIGKGCGECTTFPFESMLASSASLPS